MPRFVNNTMMATFAGRCGSDGLDNGQVGEAGVGGQYNFVAQGFALHGARVDPCAGKPRGRRVASAQSNIRWSYAPRKPFRGHLRDIIVTEYGVADLRGKSDADVIAAMLQVADSRFQDELARAAKDAGKLPKSYESSLPAIARTRRSALRPRLKPCARRRGCCRHFRSAAISPEVEQRADPGVADICSKRNARPRDLARLLLARPPDAHP